MLRFRHRIERAAEFDDVPVAVVPIVQQRKIIPDFFDRHRVPRSIPALYIGLRASESDTVPWLIPAQGRPRHSATMSSGVSVSRGAAAAGDASASLAPPIEPVWSGDFLSVMM